MRLVEIVSTYFRVLSAWISTIIASCIIWIPITFFLFHLIRLWIQWRAKKLLPHLRRHLAGGQKPLLVGFFHPYCNAGGGGERVLWVAIRALQKRYSHVRCVIYTGDTDATGEGILQKAHQRFNIALSRPNDVEFVFLRRRPWVEARPYPVFTLLGQSVGSLVLGFEALLSFVPDVYIDTMGYAFTLPLFKYLGKCRVACYVHYPTISTDMLDRVSQRMVSYNNPSFISRSPLLSSAKLLYYRLFAYAYGIAGKRSDLVLVNSSWTFGHISALWQAVGRTHVVYPPCDVEEFLKIQLVDHSGDATRSVISVAQFRPEKDHRLQLMAFQKFLEDHDVAEDKAESSYRLVLVGSCRNEEDVNRVEDLKSLSKKLKIDHLVEFDLNVPFDRLKSRLAEATCGLHTMWNEHFGIGVVECMAAGTVILAHDSGGPKLDIVMDYENERTGFLASDVDGYASALRTIFTLSEKERLKIRTSARESVKRFSDVEFETRFLDLTKELIQ